MAAAAASSTTSTTDDRRKKVLLGDLAPDFLRVGPSVTTNGPQLTGDEMAARSLQMQLNPGQIVYTGFIPPNTRGKICITLVEAKLAKNYGLVRMDPYCRLRVGNTVFETPTDVSAGKCPKWNRTMQSYLPVGVDCIHIEIFDERAFTTDERVAHGVIVLPEAVMNGETVDEWYPLSGSQGDGKEGMLNVVLSFSPLQAAQMPAYSPQAQLVPPPPPVVISEEDVNELKDMFPNLDEDVIKGILEEKRGNKDAAVNDLLALND